MCISQQVARLTFGMFVLLLILILVPGMSHAAGQGVGLKHPVLDYDIDPARAEQYEAGVEFIMAMGEEEMLSYVPDKPVFAFCWCPNCHGGAQGSNIFKWSIGHPEQLTCKYCGMVFPNDQYPDDQIMAGQNALGETVTYRYHKDKKRPELPIFYHANIAYYKQRWISQQCIYLGRAYQATGKEKYARRAILILDRIAQRYPHYPMMHQWTRTFEFPESQQPPFTPAGGKWGTWWCVEMPRRIADAYDLVYDSPEFDKLSKVRGYDVRENFENDFLKATFEYTERFEKLHTHNAAGYYHRACIKIGRVINEPRYIHWAYGWLTKMINEGFHYDGMWHECPAYHYMTVGEARSSLKYLIGYSDPPGYIDPVDGTRFDNFDPYADWPFFTKVAETPPLVAFPTGEILTVHDTWAHMKPSEPRMETHSTILPGYGHAALGTGTGADQMQAHLHFSGCHGHYHLDNLNTIVFAKGREMISDIGYTHGSFRTWTVSSIGHNLVVIDRKDQTSGNSEGKLLGFFPDKNGVSVVEVDGRPAYAAIKDLQTYRRMLALIPVSAADAYVVDVFRTTGGSVHDWLLHGDADYDMTATCSAKLPTERENMLEEGETWEPPTSQASKFIPYGLIRDVKTGTSSADILTTFTYDDLPDTGVRIHMLGDGETEVFLGRSPSVRNAKEDSRKLYDFWMPQLVLRRRGEAPLASTFVAIEEPFAGRPFIKSVERVELQPPAETAVAFRVTHGDTADTIISTLDQAPHPVRTTSDGISIQGRLGIVRRTGGLATGAWLFEGIALAADTLSLSAETGSYSGEITSAMRKADGAERDAFRTDLALPVGSGLHGAWMVVTHGNGFVHGYEIDRVDRQGDETTIILKDDHGLRLEEGKTREMHYPCREIEGKNTFVIPLSASVTRGVF